MAGFFIGFGIRLERSGITRVIVINRYKEIWLLYRNFCEYSWIVVDLHNRKLNGNGAVNSVCNGIVYKKWDVKIVIIDNGKVTKWLQIVIFICQALSKKSRIEENRIIMRNCKGLQEFFHLSNKVTDLSNFTNSTNGNRFRGIVMKKV